MLTYDIQLPAATNADLFAAFMRDTYIPAVHKGSTRIGKVTDLVLLKVSDELSAGQQGGTVGPRFLWLVGWDGLTNDEQFGPRIDDEGVQDKFKSFGATLKRTAWQEVAAWHEKEIGPV